MSSRTRFILVGLLTCALSVAAGLGLSYALFAPTPRPDVAGLLWPNPKALRPFSLVNQHGEPFALEDLEGRWTFLFFGYTNCPDVCPMTVGVLSEVETLLERQGSGKDVQFAFVSVDPARDTPEQLGRYLGFFDEDFIGATAPDGRLEGLTRQLGIAFLRDEPDENGHYAVGHSASVLLTDPEARLVAVFDAPHRAEALATDFREIRRFIDG